MTDWSTMDEILTRIDSKLHGGGDDEEDVEFELRDIAALRGAFSDLTGELYSVRKCGIPAFITGDLVMDIFNGKSFKVSDAEVSEGDNGYEWHYRLGFYFIPQSDLELVKPRGTT